jgi:hypothetical protein
MDNMGTLWKGLMRNSCALHLTILTLNTLSSIKSGLGEVEELASSRMKYSRLYVILLHLVLSAKSVYNF